LARLERHPDPESATTTAATIFDMGLSVDVHRRPIISTIDNAPDHNNRGNYQAKTCETATVTVSLLQKPVTAAAGNQGSCDKNPGKADTTDEMGVIDRKHGGNKKEGCFDPRDGVLKSGRGIEKGLKI
jgi:hypothetical protein